MHGNRIEDISEVDKLGEIPSLRKLALHGNAIENIKVHAVTLLLFYIIYKNVHYNPGHDMERSGS